MGFREDGEGGQKKMLITNILYIYISCIIYNIRICISICLVRNNVIFTNNGLNVIFLQ